MHDPIKAVPDWRPQLKWLALIAVLGTLPFWLTDLDLWAAARFYHPGAEHPWFEGGRPLWYFLYIASPLLMALVVLGSLLVLAVSRLWAPMRRLRHYALLILLSAALGPGVVVNGLLKEHWGRPRPHQVEALGGTRAYLPPLAVGEHENGKSFPSGHASVGFMFGVFYLIWRRRRPWLAWSAFAGAIALGLLMGVGRMAAGDHFLSDVIWSGVIAYGMCMLVYFVLLRIPAREAAVAANPPEVLPRPAHPVLFAGGYGVVALTLLGAVLVLMPVHDNHRDLVRTADLGPGPHVLRIEADVADVIIYWMGGDDPALIRLGVRGFGIPGSRVEHGATIARGRLTYAIEHEGIFSERDAKLVVGLVPELWDRVEARVGSGDIHVLSPKGTAIPELDLVTGDGQLTRE